MRKTTKLLAGAVAVAIGGFAMTNIASADTTVTHNPDAGITYTLNAGYPTEQTFTAGTITITDSETTITILDRNLGAIAAGTGCEDPLWDGYICPANDATYGYYFQWGNNYGFDSSTPAIGGQKQTPITYNPFYTDPVFRIDNSNWLNDNSVVDLWGGSTDDYIESLNGDNWQVSNATGRQGPCPENFHVPSYGELLKIEDMIGDDASAIHSQLLVPFAGHRDYVGGARFYELGSNAFLRSSSPYSSTVYPSYSRYLELFVNRPSVMSNNSRALAHSLRCVYDSYETYTPSGNLSSEGGDSEIVVNIGKFNNGQNTCTGQDFIFADIVASPTTITRNLVKTFQCAFGEMGQKAVTLQLQGDLTDGSGNVISSGNVKIKNSAWVGTPAGVKGNAVSTDSYTSLSNTITLFNKAGNIIGIAEGTGVDIQIEIPGGTPDGTYNGVLILSY